MTFFSLICGKVNFKKLYARAVHLHVTSRIHSSPWRIEFQGHLVWMDGWLDTQGVFTCSTSWTFTLLVTSLDHAEQVFN